MRTTIKNATTAIAGCAAGALVLTGCSTDAARVDDATALTVAASFYPLEYVAGEVGGDLVSVIPLAPPGVEPHDLELSPAAVRDMSDADLVLYLAEFQPAVDDAVASTGVAALDAATVVELHPSDHDHADEEGHEDEDHDHADEEGHEDEDHDHADEEGHEGHDHGANDPHFWLDPTLLATYAETVGHEFAELDPANADAYRANADALIADLTALDETYSTALAQCERDEIVVSHEAFGYLAERYGLHQEGIAGIDPENEPSPARLREIRDFVEGSGVTTIFTESLVNPAVAEAIAQDTGAETAVLDPVESIADGDDYAGVMDRNLQALTAALACD